MNITRTNNQTKIVIFVLDVNWERQREREREGERDVLLLV